MVKLNRIGYKLGLAGAVGVLLSMGMVINQTVTESIVAGANDRAGRSQRVADSTLTAHLDMRMLQLAGRATRLARTTEEVDKSVVEVHQYEAAGTRDIDAAFASAQRPETRERLQKIKSLMSSYSAGVEDLAKAQTNLLTLIDKRTAISTEWEKAFESQLASPAFAELPNRKDAELLLYQADGKVKALRSAIWRFSATGEESQKKTIALNKTALEEVLGRIRGLSDDKAFRNGIDAMKSIVTRLRGCQR